MDLLPAEIRVLGCLLEKQRATPDAYPLTLNSLRLACNQSTNREPVVQYSEAQVRDATQRLERRGLVRFASGAGSRAAKFRHLLAERLPMDDAEQAVICVLMLRGPQTPGELKQRSDRLHPFAGLAEVESTLERLIERGLLARVPRRPGQKEERYAHLLGSDEEQPRSADGIEPAASPYAEPAAAPTIEATATAGPTTEATATAAPTTEAAAPAANTVSAVDVDPASPMAVERELEDLHDRVQRLEREMESLKAELGVEGTS